MKQIAPIIIIIFAVYLGASFIILNMNPAIWSRQERGITVALCVVLYVMYFAWVDIHKEEN
jgi:hypothetical protein